MSKYGRINIMLVLLLMTALPAAAQWYGRTIYSEAISENTKAAVEDLAHQLEAISGQPFAVRPYNGRLDADGIYVLQSPQVLSDAQQKTLSAQSVESAFLSGTDRRLLIVANQDNGLANGIYTYLHALGCRWYFPGELWTYVPKRRDVLLTGNQLAAPSFLFRTFAGTGGLAPVTGIDPELELPRMWHTWYQRNRLGGAFIPGGHYGEDFNSKNEAVFRQHPEYLALGAVSGNRGPFTVVSKWCISNRSFRELFIEDRVDYLKDILSREVPGNRAAIVIPVEPADGGEDCACSECRKIGTVSDRIFYLANEVARAVARISDRAYVSLLAYNTHAAPPRDPVAANVYVQVIPYAFQDFASPEQMIAQWKQKCSHLLLSDYYGIPDWHQDKPLADRWSPKELATRIRYWHKRGIQGVYLESSYAIGCTGEGLYYLARLGWDVSESEDAIAAAFYRDMFGTASAPMQQFFDKLHKGYSVHTDIPLLLQYLEQGSAMAGSDKVRQRIDYFKAYIHYLVLAENLILAGNQNEAAWMAHMQYVWQLYPTAMIHASRIAFFSSQEGLIGKHPEYSFYTLLDPNKPLSLPPLTTRVIAQNFQQDKEAYARLGAAVGRSAAADYQVDYHAKAPVTADEFHEMMFLNAPVFTIRGDETGTFVCSLMSNVASGNNDQQNVTVIVVNKQNDTVFREPVTIDQNWKKVRIGKLSNKEDYRLQVINTGWFRIRTAQSQYFGIPSIPTYSDPGSLSFFVPEGTGALLFSAGDDQLPVFTAPDGKAVSSEKVKGHTYKITVPQAYQGKWWILSDTKYKFLEFYFKPALFFTHTNYSIHSK